MRLGCLDDDSVGGSDQGLSWPCAGARVVSFVNKIKVLGRYISSLIGFYLQVFCFAFSFGITNYC